MTTNQWIIVASLAAHLPIVAALIIGYWYPRAGLLMLGIIGFILWVIIGQWLKSEYWGKHEKPDNN